MSIETQNAHENDDAIPQEVERELDREAPRGEQREPKQASYKVYHDARIPVSKHTGSVWKSRLQAAERARSPYEEAWQEAVRYYNHDQHSHRNSGLWNRSGNETVARRKNSLWSETENIVFANTTTMLPALYAKNPQVETTSTKYDERSRRFAKVAERLINTLLSMKYSPGIRLKPKARRAVLNTLLTNCGWFMIGWQQKDEVTEQTMAEMEEIGQRLEKADDPNEIEELEGRLMAIERHLDLTNPDGPFVRVIDPQDIFLDPNSVEPDLSDANFLIHRDKMQTQYMNARFGNKRSDGSFESVYKPTHILRVQDPDTAHEEQINNFTIFKSDDKHSDHGFDSDDAFDNAKYTQVYWCWDKTTRRLLLFADDQWSWPVWVWDDPYKLMEFFPYYKMSFFDNPNGGYSKGEVSYYLDQQDAINDINDEWARARLWARKHIAYNSNVVNRTEAEKLLKGDTNEAIGVDVPEGMRITDHLEAVLPPGLNALPELFDTRSKLESIDRISSVSAVMRGVEFKTNTTNQAIDSYNSAANMRLDEKIDVVEDVIGSLSYGLLQMCVQYMTHEDVVGIVGDEIFGVDDARIEWQYMSPQELHRTMHMRVVGGSTAKPTSRAKKEEAVEAGQILGQFADAAPAVVLIMLKLFQEAYDEITLRDEDWEQIRQSMMMSAQRAGGGPQQQQPPAEGAEQGTMEQMLQQLPPEAQEAVMRATERGVPAQEAMQAVMQHIEGQNQQTPRNIVTQ